MRLLRAVPCVLLVACAFPVVSPADDFTDYRIPDHFGGSWNASASGFHQSSSHNQTGDASRDRVLQGNLGGSWLRFRDSDRRQWQVSLIGRVTGSRNSDREDTFFDGAPSAFSVSDHSETRGRSTAEMALLSAWVRRYPGELPIGWELSGDAQLQDAQSWNDHFGTQVFDDAFGQSRDELSSQNVSWQYREFAALRVAVGVGRVRDATPVFDALLLEERLQRDGALAHPLSPATRQRVADLYAVGPDFYLPHDLPGKFFWRELERTLREDGALADSGFDAFALRHADEALVVAGFFYRPTGWFVGPTVVASHQHELRRLDQTGRSVHFTDGTLDGVTTGSASSRQRYFTDRTLYGLTAEFHRPLGARSQFSLSEDAGVDLGPDPHGLDVSGSVLFQHLIAERWFGQLQFAHDRVLLGRPAFSSWDARVSGEIDYFLEDFVRATLSLNQEWSSVQIPAVDHLRDVTFDVQFALTFGRGRLDAPGLIRPQRALN